MGFWTIHPRPGLGPSDRRRVHRIGPPAVATRTGHDRLLVSAGFVAIEHHDVTDEYLRTLRGSLDGWVRREAEVREVVGDEYDDRIRGRGATIALVEEGALLRSRYVARRPARWIDTA